MKDKNESIILDNEDFYCKSLSIGVKVDDIMAEFNAFDWMELRLKSTASIFEDFKKRLSFKNPRGKYFNIREKAFAYQFERAVINLSALVNEVNKSYNIPSAGGVNNEELSRYYYLKYWADKKQIAVNYNETNYDKKKLFNFYTILIDIFANKLDNFNINNQKA
tara:strand:- start:1454 stop:1945 length:492 start_codon:yes stop_codon:yes gene_type:complete